MYPVPQISDLATFSGRPEASYTAFANNALLQATLVFTTLTQVTSQVLLTPDDQVLALNGICAYADYVYLRQPYQQALAGPFTSETIGSYSYSKAYGEVARNAQATEVTGEALGIYMFDLAVRMLSVRTRAGGVYTGGITVFEDGSVRFDGAELLVRCEDSRMVIRGPGDYNLVDFGSLDINAETFPQDPGVS